MSVSELLPCPFCGGAPRVLEHQAGFYTESVICDSCVRAGHDVATRGFGKSVAAWNRRTPARELDADKGGDSPQAVIDRVVLDALTRTDGTGIMRVSYVSPDDTRTPPAQAAEAVDANVEAVRAKLLARSRVGFAKYGVTTERGDLSPADWMNHLQEELMDACVYLEAARAAIAAMQAGEP